MKALTNLADVYSRLSFPNERVLCTARELPIVPFEAL